MTGTQLKEQGQRQALNHANAVIPSWSDMAVRKIAELAGIARWITADDLRGTLPAPPHHNAIGAAFSRAAKMGLIQKIGYDKARHKSAHGRVVMVWAAA